MVIAEKVDGRTTKSVKLNEIAPFPLLDDFQTDAYAFLLDCKAVGRSITSAGALDCEYVWNANKY